MRTEPINLPIPDPHAALEILTPAELWDAELLDAAMEDAEAALATLRDIRRRVDESYRAHAVRHEVLIRGQINLQNERERLADPHSLANVAANIQALFQLRGHL